MAEIAHSKLKAEKPSPMLVVEIPNEIFSWAMVYSWERGVAALRLVS